MIFLFKRKKYSNKVKGFTILELLVSLSIFAVMSALLLSKYGTFDQGVLLTNLAYDVALTIRNAQTYGLNVKSSERLTNSFNNAYGVHFDLSTKDKFIFFVDESPSDGLYNSSKTSDQITTIKRNSKIYKLCARKNSNANNCTDANKLDITFKRPDPNAIILPDGDTNKDYSYAEISVMSKDGSTRKIIVNSTGQISVQ